VTLPITESDVTNLTSDLAGKAQALAATAVKSSAYTASPGDFVPVDTTSGAVTITLPSAPALGSRAGVKLVTQGGTNTVTVACGGSDVFNKSGGSTTATLTLVNQALVMQYAAGVWIVHSTDVPLSGLDGRYQPLDSDLTAVAALSTTSYGRAFLALADAAAGRTALSLGTAAQSASTDFQPVDSDLTAIAALTTTSYGRSLLTGADASATLTLLGIEQQKGSLSADTTLTNSTTLVDVGLPVAIGSSSTEIWRVEYLLLLEAANGTMDLALNFTAPPAQRCTGARTTASVSRSRAGRCRRRRRRRSC
jgi:hypothetical protein